MLIIALYETGRQLESKRMELYQANQLSDQAQRAKSWLCEESDMRNIAFQEGRARDCQEIEELRRICCVEADRARQMKLDELSSASQLMAQIQELQDKANSLTDAKGFYDPENCEQLWIIPRSQSTHEYSESSWNDWPRLLLAA